MNELMDVDVRPTYVQPFKRERTTPGPVIPRPGRQVPALDLGEPWTDREIEKGLAFRENDKGTIYAFEICSGCKNGFPKGEGKLGHGQGKPLCRDCWEIRKVSDQVTEDAAVLSRMGEGEWIVPTLAKQCRLTQAQTEQALRNLQHVGKVIRRGRAWVKVGVPKSTLFV
jgi:hypothetical protein